MLLHGKEGVLDKEATKLAILLVRASFTYCETNQKVYGEYF